MSDYSVTLKRSDFRNETAYLIEGGISNGKWAIRTGAVSNAALFKTEALTKAFVGDIGSGAIAKTHASFESIAPGGQLHEWTATPFLFEAGSGTARIFRSTKTGELTGIDRRFLALFREDRRFASLYGRGPKYPFLFGGKTIKEAAAIFMPMVLDLLPREPAVVGTGEEPIPGRTEDPGVIAAAQRRRLKKR